MLLQILGVVLSGIISLIIAYLYYKKASTDLTIETGNLRKLNEELKTLISELGELDTKIVEDTDFIRKIIVRGSSDDLNYPYK